MYYAPGLSLREHHRRLNALRTPEPKPEHEMIGRIRDHLRACDLTHTNGDSIADSLGVAYHRMKYRLQCSGTGLRKLITEERQRRFRAAWPASCFRLADACGYRSAGDFTRAFHQWFGMTLREYRRIHG